jgi:hypothetical protein
MPTIVSTLRHTPWFGDAFFMLFVIAALIAATVKITK